MPRNFANELEDTRERLTAAMRATLPSKQFGSTIILAAVYLGLTEMNIKRAKTLKERREHIREFDRAKRAIEKGIILLRESAPKSDNSQEGQREVLP